MVDITSKQHTLRQAVATALLTVSKPETIEAVRNRQVPKGDVFEFSRAAGLLAIKNTAAVIPDCHPLPVEFASIKHEIDGLSVRIRVEVHTIYKTGVEVEAMHGAAITALTMYDMLKPIDKGVEISTIRLESKKGGKSDFLKEGGNRPEAVGKRREEGGNRQEAVGKRREAIGGEGQMEANNDYRPKTAVVVCSDSVSRGIKEDLAGKKIVDILAGQRVETSSFSVVPDDADAIQDKLKELVAGGFRLVLFTGGTGLSPRDITPDVIAPMLDREIPGIMEAARNYGQQRMPYAMFSRGVAGFIGETLVITLPGSPRGVEESMAAIFPHILHLFKVKKGERHD